MHPAVLGVSYKATLSLFSKGLECCARGPVGQDNGTLVSLKRHKTVRWGTPNLGKVHPALKNEHELV
jgi:hypothetical protein